MKHIVCVTESLAGGGAEHQMAILANFLHEKGYQVSMVTFADAEDHYQIDNRIKRVRLGIGKGHLGQSLDIIKYFLSVKADCVISYRQTSSARVSIPLLLRPKIKLISGERNVSQKKIDRHEKLLINCRLYCRSNYIVPNSITQTNSILNRRPEWRNKVVTIHNYTDINEFRSSKMPDTTSQIKVGIFARLSRQKNPIGFMKMMKELKKLYADKVIVDWYGTQKDSQGNYSPEYLDCQTYLSRNNIYDVVHFLPAVPNPASVMDNYHAICLPSLYEGFSNSIAEGICSGKPVLCSEVSDNSVMVHHGINGYLFDPNSSDSMLQAFESFLSLNLEQVRQMGIESRKIAEELFNKAKFVNSYIELIENK